MLLIVSIPAAIILNGPGFRALAEWGADKGLAAAGLGGDLTVEGSILSGIVIRDVAVSAVEPLPAADGEVSKVSPLRSLEAALVEVRYSFGPLFDGDPIGMLDLVKLQDVAAVVDLPEKAVDEVPEPDDPSEADEPKDPLAIVWKLLGCDYELDNLNARILKSGEESIVVEGLVLRLPAGGTGELGFSRLKVGDKIDRGEERAVLRSTGDSLAIEKFEPIGGIVLNEITLLRDGDQMVTVGVGAGGGNLHGSYGRDGAISAELVDSEIDLAALAKRFDFERFLHDGDLASLSASFHGDFGDPRSWDASLQLRLTGVEFEGEGIDELDLDLKVAAAALAATLDGRRHAADVEVNVEGDLAGAESIGDLSKVPAEVVISIDAPTVESFLPEGGPPVAGSAKIDGAISIRDLQPEAGTLAIVLPTLSYDGVPIAGTKLDLSIPNAGVIAAKLDVDLDEATTIDASGTFGLDKFDYRAEADGHVEANARLSELLATFGFEKSLTGTVDLDWKGTGILKAEEGETVTNSGEAKVVVRNLKFEEAQTIDSATISATYAPGDIGLRSLDLKSGTFALGASGGFSDDVVKLGALTLRDGDKLLVSGQVTVPLDLEALKGEGAAGFFNQDGEIGIDLKSNGLRLAEIAELAGAELPVKGVLDLSIAIGGSPADLTGGGSLSLAEISADAAPDVPPADLALEFALAPGNASISGRLEQPQIQPFSIQADIPFEPAKWVAGEASPTEMPISAKVLLPPTDLAFVTDYASAAVESIDGSAGIDITVGGTAGAPTVTGLVDIELADLRLVNRAAPTIRNGTIKIRGEGREVIIDEFNLLASGGDLGLSGSVAFPAEEPGPVFDLALTAKEALVARTPDLNVRTDADITFTGPWAKAKIAGEIALTNSRFIKDIDLLPLGGPKEERSDLPEIESRPTAKVPPNLDLGIDIEPFKDWEFDLKLVTRDPFRVRSNLARLDAVSDIRITGTGARPIPNGTLDVKEGRLTLPFSDVDIDVGEVKLNEKLGFNGELNVNAKAQVRNYKISIYVFGRALSPQSVLTSDPPLPPEDILSLLASGATREELASGSGAVAASKAAQFFLREMRTKNSAEAGDEKSLMEKVNERTTIDFGETDERTGEQHLVGRIRMFRQLYAVASVGPDSDYRALLQYIFKFR